MPSIASDWGLMWEKLKKACRSKESCEYIQEYAYEAYHNTPERLKWVSTKEYNDSTDEGEDEDTEDEIESDYETDYSSEEEIEEVKEKPPPKKGKGKVVKKVNYDINSGDNIIMMPREIGNLRKNRLTHNGPHKKYNMFVGAILDSLMYVEKPDAEFKEFVTFLKIGCRFRPQDIPWP